MECYFLIFLSFHSYTFITTSSKNELDILYEQFLEIADSKKEVVREDLLGLMHQFNQTTQRKFA